MTFETERPASWQLCVACGGAGVRGRTPATWFAPFTKCCAPGTVGPGNGWVATPHSKLGCP